MESTFIAGRYQITKHMKHIDETDYYVGIDTTKQQHVTLRTINVEVHGAVGIGLEHLAADKLRRKMENEQRIIAQLQLPGLLEILDHGFDAPLYYHIYPPFVFHNLQMAIEQHGCVPLTDTLNYMVEIADTLSALHRIGIIHCDISAQNILLLDHHTKLIEFTIANHEAQEGVAPGNPPYMSPEAIRGAKPAATRDIWALGVTLAYALTGELPFGDIDLSREVSAPRLFRNILHEAPNLMVDSVTPLPARLVMLIHRMLEKDPTQRVSSMQEVKTEVEEILKEQAN